MMGKLQQMSNFSSVHLSKYHIHCTNDGDNVCQHVVSANVVHEGEVEEAGGLDLAPIWLAASVRDEVDAKLSLWSLNGCVSGSSRYLKENNAGQNVAILKTNSVTSKVIITWKPWVKSLKWWMRDSMEVFISALLGGTHLASSVLTSPAGIWFRHCSMILRLSLISSILIRYRS